MGIQTQLGDYEEEPGDDTVPQRSKSSSWKSSSGEAESVYRDELLASSDVPPGPFYIVFNPQSVDRGWGEDTPLQRGVYLTARDGRYSIPPSPVAQSDEHLRAAANASLQAALELVDSEAIVAISKGTPYPWINVLTCNGDVGEQEVLFAGSDEGYRPRASSDPDLLHGFSYIRKLGPPAKIYTRIADPQLPLAALDAWNVG